MHQSLVELIPQAIAELIEINLVAGKSLFIAHKPLKNLVGIFVAFHAIKYFELRPFYVAFEKRIEVFLLQNLVEILEGLNKIGLRSQQVNLADIESRFFKTFWLFFVGLFEGRQGLLVFFEIEKVFGFLVALEKVIFSVNFRPYFFFARQIGV